MPRAVGYSCRSCFLPLFGQQKARRGEYGIIARWQLPVVVYSLCTGDQQIVHSGFCRFARILLARREMFG
jgi:hypothetical protein